MEEEKLLAFYEIAIEEIAKGSDLENILNIAKDLFGLPIIAVGAGYHLLAISTVGKKIDPYWQQIIDHGVPTEETIIKSYLNAGMLDRITKSEGALYIDWGVSEPYPQTSGPILIEGALEGFISVLFMEDKKLALSLSLNKLLCQLAAIILRANHYQLQHTVEPMLENFARQFFDPETFSYEDFLKHSDLINLTGYGTILFLTPAPLENEKILAHLKQRLKKLHSKLLYIEQNNLLKVFLYGLKEPQLPQVVKKTLQEYPLFCGASNFFQHFQHRESLIQQAQLALQHAEKIQQAPKFYAYENYLAEILLENIDSQILQENLYLSDLTILKKYDQEHATDFLITLGTYLFQRNDVTKTAEKLHLHRNTLTYRLQKISQLIAKDFNQPFTAWQLQLSYGNYFQEKIKKLI